MASLIIQEKEQPERHFPILKTPIIIGRIEGCDIRIRDAKSSRRHLKISVHNQEFFAEDLKSFNGTLLNNKPLTKTTPIRVGDKLSIGFSTITVAAQAKKEATPLSAPSPKDFAYTLRIYWGEKEELCKTLTADLVVLGRLESNDVPLTGVGVSRKHAEIKRNGTSFKIIDLGSRNGIRVDGNILKQDSAQKETTLKFGSMIEIGSVKIRFEAPSSPSKKTKITEKLEKKEEPQEGAEVSLIPTTFHFPMLNHLGDKELKEKLENNLYKFNLAEIDLGLAFFHKILKEELHAYLSSAKENGEDKIETKDFDSLDSMLRCLYKLDLVSEKEHAKNLSLLQAQEDNLQTERLNLDKRKQLMKSTQLLGEIYVDYIFLFNSKRNEFFL